MLGRLSVRWFLALPFLFLACADYYYYRPDEIFLWLGIRLLFAAFCLMAFELIDRRASRDELENLNRAKFLKHHFPAQLREMIERGEHKLPRKRTYPQAVVGFADITSSTQIGNIIGLSKDWEIRQKFFAIATKCATDAGLIVLNHTGDGFLFLANYFENANWPYSLMSFYESLLVEFENLVKAELGEDDRIHTGIRVGVASGPAVVGFLDGDVSCFTAMGPDVNLAARLCRQADNNQLLVSSRVWHSLKNIINGWMAREANYKIRGFDQIIPCVHLDWRLRNNEGRICDVCHTHLRVVQNDEGAISLACPSGHAEDGHKSAA